MPKRRRSAVSSWLREHMAHVDQVRAADAPVSWAEIALLMRSEGVVSATALSARQTYWRLKRPPERWSYERAGEPVDKPVEKPAGTGGPEASAVDQDDAAQTAAKRRLLRRIGQ